MKKVIITKDVQIGQAVGTNETCQMMSERDFKKFEKGAKDLGLIKEVVVNGKVVTKKMYRILEKKVNDTKELTRKEMFTKAKELNIKHAKNISNDKLLILIEEAQ